MPAYNNTRLVKVRRVQHALPDGEVVATYELPQTTVPPWRLPAGTVWYSVGPREIFEDIAEREYPDLGGADLYWVLAYCNPQIRYPLDLQEGDRILLPPPDWVQRFVVERDDWIATWFSSGI